LFPYSPNAVIVGFITTTIGSVIAMFVLPTFGLAMILPGILTNFFAGGTAGIFGNLTGGRRGAIIGGILILRILGKKTALFSFLTVGLNSNSAVNCGGPPINNPKKGRNRNETKSYPIG